jgi:hypothetical protein
MASCLLAFGSVVRSGGGSQGERVGEACARACGLAHGRPRHCDPDRPRHQRQRPNASANRLIVVLVAVVVGSVAICVELLGMQVPGSHVAAMTRAAAPVATASPWPTPPVAADPVATASPSGHCHALPDLAQPSAHPPSRPAMYPGCTWHPPPVDLHRHRANPSNHADASDSAEMSTSSVHKSMHPLEYSLTLFRPCTAIAVPLLYHSGRESVADYLRLSSICRRLRDKHRSP